MTFNYQQHQNQDGQQFQQITSLDQVLQPSQNTDQHFPWQQQNYNQHYPQQARNLAQQSYSQQIQQQQIQNYAQHAHQQIYEQRNNNSDNMMMTTLPQQQQQSLYNTFTSSPAIYSNDDDPLVLRISGRLLMIKDCIMTMNQQYAELEQDFIKLRRRYN